MAAWYYTDALARQQGPVDDLTLLALNREGGVRGKTLVWQEGGDWTPFQDVAPRLFALERAAADGEGAAPDTLVDVGVCAHSGRVYPLPELLPYGEALIGPDHKDDFVRRLMEGAVTGIADATEHSVNYVGFWWRALSSTLDYMIKMLPYGICMIPYYVVAMVTDLSIEKSVQPGEVPDLDGDMVLLFLSYGISSLLTLAFSIFYETWMVGRYGGTLGKLIIGARVVNPDGSKLTYKRAFLRWVAKKPVAFILLIVPVGIGTFLMIASPMAVARSSGEPALVVATIIGSIVAFLALAALGSGIYWMAAFDPERRALHDRIASTRVVRK